jgi:hypothetical protein
MRLIAGTKEDASPEPGCVSHVTNYCHGFNSRHFSQSLLKVPNIYMKCPLYMS